MGAVRPGKADLEKGSGTTLAKIAVCSNQGGFSNRICNIWRDNIKKDIIHIHQV